MIDLNKCKKGDKVGLRNGDVVEYDSNEDNTHWVNGSPYFSHGFYYGVLSPSGLDVVEILPDEQTKEIEETVCDIIRSRRDKGREKYGTTMERNDLSFLDWINHLQQELLDAAIYAEKLKCDFENKA